MREETSLKKISRWDKIIKAFWVIEREKNL